MEKPNITHKNNYIKDGFQIIFPKTCLNIKERHFIRNEAIKRLSKLNMLMEFNDDMNTILDSSVVNSNGWFVYGARKPNREPYKLTHIFNTEMNNVELKIDYIDYFSIRGNPNTYCKKK